MNDYRAFLEAKVRLAHADGLSDLPALPPALFPFQRAIVERHLRLGRGAVFAGTGLGKTGMQLAWADAIERATGARALILTPLAVAEQTIAEASRFDIAGAAYAPDQSRASSRIVVTNYDRADKFDPGAFGAVVLDESSILKAHDGKTRIALTEAFAKHRFRLCCTATPAPNDFVELGNHSEFLGIMSDKEMLATYFVHDGANRADGGGDGWRLKRHAERDFWAWVASWATFLRHPRDIGFEQPGYDLPPLVKHQITVAVDYAPSLDSGTLFPIAARTLGERIGARKQSLTARVEAAARIVNAHPDRPWLIWCNLNAEAEALERAVPGAVQVQGSDERDVKAARLLGFCRGEPLKLITKTSIGGFGMNWQHCWSMVCVGLNDSWEQLFQGIRRCWRFGQTRAVDVYLIASELEGAVVANLEGKERDYEIMSAAMAEHMREFTEAAFGAAKPRPITIADTPMELPSWLAAA